MQWKKCNLHCHTNKKCNKEPFLDLRVKGDLIPIKEIKTPSSANELVLIGKISNTHKHNDWATKGIDKVFSSGRRKYENYSYYVTEIDKSKFNLNNKTWCNPSNKKIKSNDSFFELYDKAIKECTTLFDATHKYINDKISLDDYKKILKDNSYVNGLSWRKKYELKYFSY